MANDKTPAIAASGKFLERLGQKFFLKAMRLEQYAEPLDFNQKLIVLKRFEQLRLGHTTGVILAEAQAEQLLGLVARAGLYALVEIEALPEELLDSAKWRLLRGRVARTAKTLRGHPALIGYLIDCPVEPAELQHGFDLKRRRLRALMRMVREQGSRDRLVGLRHRTATVGLALLEEDFIFATMPGLSPAELREYVIRLHNLAEARPLVIEFCEGLPGQDELVDCAFGLGAAGVVAPAMQPAASPGALGIRMLSAGEFLPFVTLNGSCPPRPAQAPMVSVVICAYNAERTMRPCLESLRRLDYPNFEVIIVDDGSRDRTAEISMDFPEFRLIRQSNKGLSVARNVGMQAARGEVIAYTDSDCVVDPHWLLLMLRAMADGNFDGCGGPNYAPHEEGRIEACVAASPGAPCHVLIGDDQAEHLAGCNMVYRKSALLAIGGFDPQFTSAGDDVDICWRLIDAGFTLGFCPAAFVWHFRRNTIAAYYGQQRGYGRAEAMLYPKYPERFNALGQIRWRGTIPGLSRTVPMIAGMRFSRTRRHGEFQRVRDAQLSIATVLPLTPEWNIAGILTLAASWTAGITLIPALLMLAAGPAWAIFYAARAPLEKCHRGLWSRILVAFLAWSGPLARTIARYKYRRTARQSRIFDLPPRQRPTINWKRRIVGLAYWNEKWTTRDAMLERLGRLFARTGHPAVSDPGWNEYDLTVAPDNWTRIEIRTADEEHEGGRLKNHIAARVRLSRGAKIGLATVLGCALIATATGWATLALGFAIVAAGTGICALSEMIETGRLAYRAIEQCAAELDLVPLGRALRSAEPRVAAVTEPLPADSRGSTVEVAQPAGR